MASYLTFTLWEPCEYDPAILAVAKDKLHDAETLFAKHAEVKSLATLRKISQPEAEALGLESGSTVIALDNIRKVHSNADISAVESILKLIAPLVEDANFTSQTDGGFFYNGDYTITNGALIGTLAGTLDDSLENTVENTANNALNPDAEQTSSNHTAPSNHKAPSRKLSTWALAVIAIILTPLAVYFGLIANRDQTHQPYSRAELTNKLAQWTSITPEDKRAITHFTRDHLSKHPRDNEILQLTVKAIEHDVIMLESEDRSICLDENIGGYPHSLMSTLITLNAELEVIESPALKQLLEHPNLRVKQFSLYHASRQLNSDTYKLQLLQTCQNSDGHFSPRSLHVAKGMSNSCEKLTFEDLKPSLSSPNVSVVVGTLRVLRHPCWNTHNSAISNVIDEDITQRAAQAIPARGYLKYNDLTSVTMDQLAQAEHAMAPILRAWFIDARTTGKAYGLESLQQKARGDLQLFLTSLEAQQLQAQPASQELKQRLASYCSITDADVAQEIQGIAKKAGVEC